MTRYRYIAGLALALQFGFGTGAFAADAYTTGVALFGRNDYQGAIECFTRAVKADPTNSNAIYYLANSYQRSGQAQKAQRLYQLCVSKFSGTTAARYSAQSLSSMVGRASGVTSAKPASSANGDYIPDQESVGFKTDSAGHPVVSAQINGRAIDLVFDTGAEATIIGKNHASSIGLAIPSGPTTVSIAAAGGTNVGAWSVPAVVQVGQIKRSVEVLILEKDYPYASLGVPFFGDLAYKQDNNAHLIRFARRDQAATNTLNRAGSRNSIVSSSGYGQDVPFRLDGASMIVDLKIDGRPLQAVFDSGAASSIRLSMAHLKQLGIQPPADAQRGQGSGFGGGGSMVRFKVGRVEMGPLVKNNVDIYASEGSMQYPIVGQEFISGRSYTVDRDKRVIRFSN